MDADGPEEILRLFKFAELGFREDILASKFRLGADAVVLLGDPEQRVQIA